MLYLLLTNTTIANVGAKSLDRSGLEDLTTILHDLYNKKVIDKITPLWGNDGPPIFLAETKNNNIPLQRLTEAVKLITDSKLEFMLVPVTSEIIGNINSDLLCKIIAGRKSNLPVPVPSKNGAAPTAHPFDDLILPQDVLASIQRYMRGLAFQAEATKANIQLHNDMQNILISGPAGVGKTTLAIALGQEILRTKGADASKPVKVVKPGDVIGDYVGQSVNNLRRIFEENRDGVVVFDEIDTYREIAKYGDEVLNALNTHIGNEPNKPIIIATTYEGGKHAFFGANAGLSSRFRTQLGLKGQDDGELAKILLQTISYTNMKLETNLHKEAENLISQIRSHKKQNFGHIREVGNIRAAIMENMAERLHSHKYGPDSATPFEFRVLAADIPQLDRESGLLVRKPEPQKTEESGDNTNSGSGGNSGDSGGTKGVIYLRNIPKNTHT